MHAELLLRTGISKNTYTRLTKTNFICKYLDNDFALYFSKKTNIFPENKMNM